MIPDAYMGLGISSTYILICGILSFVIAVLAAISRILKIIKLGFIVFWAFTFFVLFPNKTDIFRYFLYSLNYTFEQQISFSIETNDEKTFH